MKKIILFLFVIFGFTAQMACAEKVPVKIEPTKVISTHTDGAIELGDWIPFVIVEDVYKGKTLYLKSTTPIYGKVDYFHPNGWAADYAEIRFKEFVTKDAQGNKITINYSLDLDGNKIRANEARYEGLTRGVGFISAFSMKIATLLGFFRGAEIYVEPDTRFFNLIIEV